MIDYRLPENRRSYFDALYRLNLQHGIMPGLVYLYMPALRHHYNWSQEQALWFAFLNGNTQNPLTSLRIMKAAPEPAPISRDWLNDHWGELQFDTDRRYQKRELPESTYAYCQLIRNAGFSQHALLSGSWFHLWNQCLSRFRSFGRLASWSYLEYVYIMGAGALPDRLYFEHEGSRSHRNGMFFLLGEDRFVRDKRFSPSRSEEPLSWPNLYQTLEAQAAQLLRPLSHPEAHLFTLESNLCTFKNHFFGHRYPGIYADMAYDRLKWYETQNGPDEHTAILWAIREILPNWLRLEHRHDGKTIKQRAKVFAETGYPYRGEYFL